MFLFNKIYHIYKALILNTSKKQKNRIFLLKDTTQYKIENFNLINYFVGKNWPLGNKKIFFLNFKLLNILKYILYSYIYIYIYFLIII